MKKQDFVLEVAREASLSQAAVGSVLDAIQETVVDELNKGGEVTITGFGTFRVSARPARTGVNPRTKEKISIAAKRTPVFRAGKTFKDAIR